MFRNIFRTGSKFKMVLICGAVTLALILAGLPPAHSGFASAFGGRAGFAADSAVVGAVGGAVLLASAEAAGSGGDATGGAVVGAVGGAANGAVLLATAEAAGVKGNNVKVKELSLEEALELAHENNANFKLLELAKEQAKIELSQASSQADKIDFDRVVTSEMMGVTIETYPTPPTLQFAQAKYVNEKAKEAAKVKAEKNFEVYNNTLELLITKEYYSVLEAAEVLEVKEAALKRAEKQFKNAEAAHKVGMAAKTDVLGAEAGVAGARADLTNAKNQYEVAVVELNKAIGIDLNTPLKLTTEVELAPLGEVDLDAVTEEALAERADIVAAIKDKEVADENYDVCVAYTARNTYVSRLAKVGADMAAINVEETKKAAQSELLSSYLNVIAAGEALEALKGSVKVREEVMRLTELRYDVGLVTTLDILQASEQLMETQVAYVQAIHRYNLAKLTFETAKVFPVSASAGMR